ncbi:MAG: D-2-hydroxyacid dehydrogenase [Myxococcota bacterium]
MRRWLVFLVLIGCLTAPESVARRSPPRVVVMGLSADEVAALRTAVPQVQLVPVADEEAARGAIVDAEGFLGRPSPQLVAAGERLRWIQVYSAGVDRYRFAALTQSEIVLTNAKIVQGPNVADHAVALLLVLTRGLHVALRKHGAHDWRGTRRALREGPRRPIELSDKIALVVGLGGIGSAIAERAAGFGMRVIATKRDISGPRPPHVESIHRPSELHALLPQADVVFLAVPLTEQTRGLLGATELAVMKPDAFLINIARGPVIDTDALVATLEGGRLAGVGLDVTDPEPLPPEHPLWTIDRVVITPHMAGTSDRVWARKLELLEDNLRRFANDEPLRNVVDKAQGY